MVRLAFLGAEVEYGGVQLAIGTFDVASADSLAHSRILQCRRFSCLVDLGFRRDLDREVTHRNGLCGLIHGFQIAMERGD